MSRICFHLETYWLTINHSYLIGLTIAPAFLTAAIYLCLSRMVAVIGSSLLHLHLHRLRHIRTIPTRSRWRLSNHGQDSGPILPSGLRGRRCRQVRRKIRGIPLRCLRIRGSSGHSRIVSSVQPVFLIPKPRKDENNADIEYRSCCFHSIDLHPVHLSCCRAPRRFLRQSCEQPGFFHDPRRSNDPHRRHRLDVLPPRQSIWGSLGLNGQGEWSYHII